MHLCMWIQIKPYILASWCKNNYLDLGLTRSNCAHVMIDLGINMLMESSVVIKFFHIRFAGAGFEQSYNMVRQFIPFLIF